MLVSSSLELCSSTNEARRKAEKLINIDLFVSRFYNILSQCEIVIHDCRIVATMKTDQCARATKKRNHKTDDDDSRREQARSSTKILCGTRA